MIPISRAILLAAGLLAFPVAGAVAQQTNEPDNGSMMKNNTSGASGDARAARPSTGSAGGPAQPTTTMGDTGSKTGGLPPGVATNQQPRPQH